MEAEIAEVMSSSDGYFKRPRPRIDLEDSPRYDAEAPAFLCHDFKFPANAATGSMIFPLLRTILVLFLLLSCMSMSWNFFMSIWLHDGLPVFRTSTSAILPQLPPPPQPEGSVLPFPLESAFDPPPPPPLPPPPEPVRKGHLVPSWTSAAQFPNYRDMTSPPFRDLPIPFANTTLRQTLQLTLGGSQIRLRLSNAFGLDDLPVTRVSIALPQEHNGQLFGARSVRPETLRLVTFGGEEEGIEGITIPPGGTAVSDPIAFFPPLEPEEVVTVTLYLASGQIGERTTAHIGSRSTTWMAFGDHTLAPSCPERPDNVPLYIESLRGHRVPYWFFLSAVEVWSPAGEAKSLLVLGDSITNGRGGAMNVNGRWTQFLFQRMRAVGTLGEVVGIGNLGAGGNRVLADGWGAGAVARLEREVLSRSGVGYVAIFEGINDIGHTAPTETAQDLAVARLIQGYKQLITQIHALGLPVFGGTITPFFCGDETSQTQAQSLDPDSPHDEQTSPLLTTNNNDANPDLNSNLISTSLTLSQPRTSNRYALDPIRESTRQTLNAWIRNTPSNEGGFDAVLDFDEALRSEGNWTLMGEAWHSGDCLHPNDAGNERLAEVVDLGVFVRWAGGVGQGEWG